MQKIVSSFMILISSLYLFSCSSDKLTDKDKNKNDAKIVFLLGDVKVKKTSKEVSAEQDMILKEGDILKTSSGAQCNILVGKDSYIAIKEKSILAIDTILKVDEKENTVLELKIGSTIIKPKKLLKSESFRVKTPTAVAAVRGTKFVIESHPKKKLVVSVVEGKVSLKKRVVSLEKIENEEIKNSEIVSQIQDKLDEEEMIITKDQTATIDNKKADKLNKEVNEVIATLEKQKKAEDKEQKLEEKEIKKIEEKVEKITKNLDTNVKKVEIKLVKEINKETKKDVKKLDVFIKKDKKVRLKLSKLIVSSPLKRSKIYVNNRFKGYGTVKVSVAIEKETTVKVVTPGFKEYKEVVTLKKDETKSINVALERKRLKNRIAWKKRLGSQVKGNILYYKNKLIATTSKGKLVVMKNNGKIEWQKKLSGGIESTPSIKNNNIFLVTNDKILYSIKLKDGKITWKKKLEGSLLFGAKPILLRKKIFIAASNGSLYMFTLSGKRLWKRDLNIGVYTSPVYDKKNLYIGTDANSMYAVGIKNGKVSWTSELDSRMVSSSPIIAGSQIYLCTYNGKVYSIKRDDGEHDWTYDVKSSIVATPILYKKSLIIAAKDGVTVSLNRNSGNIIWKYNSKSDIVNSPVYYKGSIYIPGGRNVYAVNANSGKEIWVYKTDSKVRTSITSRNNKLYLGTEKGEVISLRVDLKEVIKSK